MEEHAEKCEGNRWNIGRRSETEEGESKNVCTWVATVAMMMAKEKKGWFLSFDCVVRLAGFIFSTRSTQRRSRQIIIGSTCGHPPKNSRRFSPRRRLRYTAGIFLFIYILCMHFKTFHFTRSSKHLCSFSEVTWKIALSNNKLGM